MEKCIFVCGGEMYHLNLLLATLGTNNLPCARLSTRLHPGPQADRDTAPRVAVNGRSSLGRSLGKVGRLDLALESRFDGADAIR